jgi:hypothetical protein
MVTKRHYLLPIAGKLHTGTQRWTSLICLSKPMSPWIPALKVMLGAINGRTRCTTHKSCLSKFIQCYPAIGALCGSVSAPWHSDICCSSAASTLSKTLIIFSSLSFFSNEPCSEFLREVPIHLQNIASPKSIIFQRKTTLGNTNWQWSRGKIF